VLITHPGPSVTSLVEGRNAVLEALRAGVEFDRILVVRDADRSKAIDEILSAACDRAIKVAEVPRGQLDALSVRGAHQGVVAEVAPFGYTTIADVLARVEDEEQALIIALDHITDPQNLGAVARTAEVVGAKCLLIPSKRSATVGPAAMKVSAGALAHLPVAKETNLVRALEQCKDAGFWVAGASETADQDVWDAPLEGRIVVVLGAEDSGLSRLVEERCDFLVGLPVAGEVGSLNVAQAATAIAFEWVRRQRFSQGS